MMSRRPYSRPVRSATAWRATIATVIAAVAVSPAHAADDVQVWSTFATDFRVAPHTQLTVDIIARSNPDSFDLGQLVVRGGVRQELADGTNLAVNYGWFHTLVADGIDTTEHRLSQALTQRLFHSGRFTADARLSVEERLPDTGGAIGVRVRPRVRITRTLAPGFDAQINEEMIFSANSTAWGQRSGFAANRLGGQLHWVLDHHFGISPGYFWQHVPRSGAPDRNDHVLQVAVDAHF